MRDQTGEHPRQGDVDSLHEHAASLAPLGPHLDAVVSLDPESLVHARPERVAAIDVLLGPRRADWSRHRFVRLEGRFARAMLVIAPDGRLAGVLPAWVER